MRYKNSKRTTDETNQRRFIDLYDFNDLDLEVNNWHAISKVKEDLSLINPTKLLVFHKKKLVQRYTYLTFLYNLFIHELVFRNLKIKSGKVHNAVAWYPDRLNSFYARGVLVKT